MSTINAVFNSYDIQTGNLLMSGIVHETWPVRIFHTEELPRQERRKLVDAYFKERRIIVSGKIYQTSQSNADTELDDLKKNLVGLEQYLDIDFAGSTRRYIASVRTVRVNRKSFHIDSMPYIIEFQCFDPFGYATSDTNHSDDAITSTPHSDSVTIGGTYKPKPTITITVDSETDMTKLEFENTTTGDKIAVEQSFNATDVLEIDCDAMTVKVNGTEVDFNGVFPEFVVGSNGYTITITDTGAFSIDLDVDYTPTFT